MGRGIGVSSTGAAMRHIGATPAEQIVWLENRVKELEEQLYLQHQCKEALEHELSSTQSTISSYPSPAEALSAVIQWNIDVATDPLTNGGMVLVPVELL
jgi:uncharacterized coiled-coil protein SlyX